MGDGDGERRQSMQSGWMAGSGCINTRLRFSCFRDFFVFLSLRISNDLNCSLTLGVLSEELTLKCDISYDYADSFKTAFHFISQYSPFTHFLSDRG